MDSICTEGVILQALDFQDHNRILTVFSPDQGLFKCIIRQRKGSVSTDTLTRGEFICLKGKSDLLKCREISVITQYIALRKEWKRMEISFELVKAVLKTQFPGKQTPLLYTLFVRYLEALTTVNHPQTILTSFLLKLLRHEGLLGDTSCCGSCNAPLKDLQIFQGESFCFHHAPPSTIEFSKEETAQFHELLNGRSLNDLNALQLCNGLAGKVKSLFFSCLN